MERYCGRCCENRSGSLKVIIHGKEAWNWHVGKGLYWDRREVPIGQDTDFEALLPWINIVRSTVESVAEFISAKLKGEKLDSVLSIGCGATLDGLKNKCRLRKFYDLTFARLRVEQSSSGHRWSWNWLDVVEQKGAEDARSLRNLFKWWLWNLYDVDFEEILLASSFGTDMWYGG